MTSGRAKFLNQIKNLEQITLQFSKVGKPRPATHGSSRLVVRPFHCPKNLRGSSQFPDGYGMAANRLVPDRVKPMVLRDDPSFSNYSGSGNAGSRATFDYSIKFLVRF